MERLHYIRRNNLCVSTDSRNAYQLQERLRHSLEHRILPALSRALDNLATDDQWLVIDRLDVDIGALNEAEAEDEFVSRVIDQVTKAVRGKADLVTSIEYETDENPTFASGQQRIDEAFIYFLDYGFLPWWFSITSFAEFERSVERGLIEKATSRNTAGALKFISKLKTVLRKHEAAMRLITQLNFSVGMSVVKLIAGSDSSGRIERVRSFFRRLENYPATAPDFRPHNIHQVRLHFFNCLARTGEVPRIEELVLLAVLQMRSHDALFFLREFQSVTTILTQEEYHALAGKLESDIEFVKEEFQYQAPGMESKDKTAEENKLKAELEEGSIIQNAGLVIVAPFLTQLFANLGITNQDELVEKYYAVAVLHYIVHKDLDYREYHTTLNKVLCGFENHEHIEPVGQLREGHELTIEELMGSIVAHWKILGNVSPDGLRNGFLQRAGRLTCKDGNWKLKVEQKSIDVLMNDLPWGIGFIKLPWMKTLLRTEWI